MTAVVNSNSNKDLAASGVISIAALSKVVLNLTKELPSLEMGNPRIDKRSGILAGKIELMTVSEGKGITDVTAWTKANCDF